MTNAVDHMLAEIRKLAPEIPSRAAEIKTARRMPPDLVDKLKKIGLYRMFVPRSHGGLELDFPEGVRVTAELGKIEGSLGWTAMIAMGSGLVTSLLPLETYNRVYESGPDVTLAGSSQPAGTAEAVPGGGRWPFASGCQQAEWMLTFCIMTKDGKPLAGSAGDDGPPLVRGFILAASEWQIEDTWHVAGLKGTGSNHIAIANKFVPETSFFNIENAVPCVPGPLHQAPLDFLPMTHSAFAVGAAQGAVKTNSSSLRIPAGGSFALRLRCVIRKCSRANSVGPKPTSGQRRRSWRCRQQATGATRWLEQSRTARWACKARRPPCGSPPPTYVSPTRASHWLAAAPFTTPRRCSAGCVTFMLARSTLRSSNDNMRRSASCVWT
jgi:hypothetical protein